GPLDVVQVERGVGLLDEDLVELDEHVLEATVGGLVTEHEHRDRGGRTALAAGAAVAGAGARRQREAEADGGGRRHGPHGRSSCHPESPSARSWGGCAPRARRPTASRTWRPDRSTERAHPFTAPTVMPLTKYFWTNG